MIELPFDIMLLDGYGEPATFRIERAGKEYLDQVLEMQDRIMNTLPNPDVYAPFTEEETVDQLWNDLCYVAFAENGDIAGFSVLIPNDREDQSNNYGHYFDYDDEHLARTASMDFTMVAPEYRGYGLQRVFNKIRHGDAIKMGATEAITSISPSNPYSLNNFFVLQYEVADRRKLYGGKDRYLLRKEFKK